MENQIIHGDCLEKLPDIEKDSIDCIVTDPPYGMSFMGKNWDKAVPSVAIWRECLRVLKPGAFAFVMCIPRQDSLAHMIVNLGDAGFNVAFSSIYWTYATGFPKAQNLSKAADKRGGVSVSWFGKWLKEWRIKNNISQKDIAKLFPSKTGGLTGCVANWELGLNMPTPKQFTKICRHFDLPFENIEEAEREVISRTQMTIGMGGSSERMESEKIVSLSETPQAKALDGAYGGFQLKPAVEIIIVAMKPLEEKTYVDQAMANMHGCTWLDDCRIPYESEDFKKAEKKRDSWQNADYNNGFISSDGPGGAITLKGRFPANVLCEDNVLDDGRITKSTGGEGERKRTTVFKGTEGRKHFHYGDTGDFSRYFSLDAWFVERIKLLPKEAQRTFPWLIVPKASKSEKNRGLLFNAIDNSDKYGGKFPCYKADKDSTNKHPTCKPIKLMSWLIILGTREGDTVLDPFCGSGTTCAASKILGRRCKGIEREEEYSKIARKRISAIPTNLSRF